MNARQYLKRAQRATYSIDRKLDDLKFYRIIAEGVQGQDVSKDKVQSSPRPDKMENAAIKCIEIEEEIEEAIVVAMQIRKETAEKLELLPPKEGDALYKFYLEQKSVDEIAVEIDRSTVGVKKIMQRGLKHLQEILNNERNETNN